MATITNNERILFIKNGEGGQPKDDIILWRSWGVQNIPKNYDIICWGVQNIPKNYDIIC